MQHKNTNKETPLTKAIRDSGLCSRRGAKELLDKGKITVNGKIIYSPCFKIKKTDEIIFNGKKINLEQQQLKIWLYHKPVGLITTHKDPQKRQTVFDALPKNLPKVISIGRLDLNSSGLLLLTNSGDFARFMELPKNNFKRVYKVRVFGNLDSSNLKKLEQGCIINKIKYGKIVIKILKSSKNNHWLQVTMCEGKNREIRKLFAHINLTVTKLVRVQYGSFHLGNLKAGNLRQETIPKNLYEDYIRNS